MGSVGVSDILIYEEIDGSVFYLPITEDYSQRGLWNIDYLGPDDEIEIVYIVGMHSNIGIHPELFGTDQSNVFKTVIFSDKIVTVISHENNEKVEIINMIIAGVLFVFFLIL